MNKKTLFILLFLLFNNLIKSQSDLVVYNRTDHLEIRVDFDRIPELIKKYSDSKIPIHLQLEILEEDDLKEENFIELAKLPLSFFRFNVWKKEKFYCKGLEYLQSLDSLEMGGYSQSFLQDASRLKELSYLRLEVFWQDSTVKQKCSFQNLQKLYITISGVYDLSQIFDSLPNVNDFNIQKNDGYFNLASSIKVFSSGNLREFGLGLVSIDTTNFKNSIIPGLKKCSLIGVSNGTKNFDFEKFIVLNPSLEYVNLRMNSLDKKYVGDLRQKFPKIIIEDI